MFELKEYSSEDRVNILKRFPIEKRLIDNNIELLYQSFDSEECISLRKEWEIPEKYCNSDSFKSVIEIMRWFKCEFNFPNKCDNYGIEFLVDGLCHSTLYEKIKKKEIPFVSKFETLFFSYVLLSLGYKARRVVCMSLGFSSRNCIYMVEAYLACMEKWIAIDITNNTVYCDYNGTPLNLVEIRNNIQMNKGVMLYSNSKKIRSDIYSLLTINLFAYKYVENNKIDCFSDPEIKYYVLAPEVLCGTNKTVNNLLSNQLEKYIFNSNESNFYKKIEQ